MTDHLPRARAIAERVEPGLQPLCSPNCDGCIGRRVARIQQAIAAYGATVERETLERAAEIADEWANSESCRQHEDNPCCHVRTGAAIAAKLRQRAKETR